MPSRAMSILRLSRGAFLCQLSKMASPIPDLLIAAYARDGKWEFQTMQMALVHVYPSQWGLHAVRYNQKLKRAPPRIPSSLCLEDVLESLCKASVAHGETLLLSSDLLVRVSRIESLGTHRVDGGNRFGGKLAHWSKLVEATGAPNIVVYLRADKQFYVVCAKARNTQRVETRSAICWLRDGAGLGFFDSDGHVFRIEAARSFFDEQDPWGESLLYLLSSVSALFPVHALDER